MDQCETLQGDLSSLYPVTLGRKAPTWRIPVTNDGTNVLDCSGAGVTINTSTWAVHPDDDDGSITISGETIIGLTTRAWVSGGMDGCVYRVLNTVVASDVTQVVFEVSLPVVGTRPLHA